MVTPNARRNRGQVILIGAITLAFILLGIVVVFNGVLYTETISSSSTSQSTADAEVVGQNLEQDLVEIANQTNWNEGEFKSNITSSGGFADQYRNVTASSRSVFVNVSSPESEEIAEYGYIANGLVGNSHKTIELDDSVIEHLVLNLSASSHDSLEINATTADGNSSNVTIEANGDSFIIGGCIINSNKAKFDLVTGQIDGVSSLSCNPQGDLSVIENDGGSPENYSSIKFSGGNLGSYKIVARNGFNHSPDGHYFDIWKLNINIMYRSNHVSYVRTVETVVIDGDNE